MADPSRFGHLTLLAAAMVAAAAVGSARSLDERAVGSANQALSGRRMALVVGMQAYPAGALRNAVNDARAVTNALQAYGFQVVQAIDGTHQDLTRRIEEFATSLRPGDVALFYYAGHGIQIDGENYVLPIDFKGADEIAAKYEGYPVSRVAERIERTRPQLSVIVLDACRNNPYRTMRSGTRGLAPMDSGRGSLVAFATAPNRTADDNPAGNNGLFTTHLLTAMNEPGLDIEQVFSRVRQRVYDASKGQQIPWLVSSVIGTFAFRPAAASSVAAASPAPSSTVILNWTATLGKK